MTPNRYRECLAFLGLSQRGLAPALCCSDRLTRAWATGASTIPPEIADWLEACVRNRKRYPDPLPPADWRRRRVAAVSPAPSSLAVAASQRQRLNRRKGVG